MDPNFASENATNATASAMLLDYPEDSAGYVGPNDPVTRGIDIFFLTLGSVVGTAGNALIFLAVARVEALQSAINWIVVNIALADFIVCCYAMPSVLANRIAYRNLSSEWLCVFNAYLMFLCAGVSNFSFMLIAINRYTYILHQNLYRRIFTMRKLAAICATFWLMWFGYSAVVAALHGFTYIPDSYLCFYFDDNTDFAVSFMLTLLGVGAPSLLAAVCYSALFYRLFSTSRQNQDLTWSRRYARERAALVPVVAAFCVFNLCWGPYSVHVYIDKFAFPVPRRVHNIILWLAMFNSCINCIIYGIFNKNFRRGYITALGLRRCLGSGTRVAPVEMQHAAAAAAAAAAASSQGIASNDSKY